MAITKKLIHFKNFSDFNSQKLSADKDNTTYTVGVGGAVVNGEPYILYHSIVFIKDVLKIWTHGSLYDCGVPDLSEYITSEEIASIYASKDSVDAKQDKVLKFINLTASSWVSDSTYAEFPYRCDIACSGVTADMYAEVAFSMEQAASGNYAPICETKADIVSVWSKENTSITIPTIIVTK